MFVLGFLVGIASFVGMAGLLLLITRPWRLRDVCDAVLAAPGPQDHSVGYAGPLPTGK